MGKTNGAIQWGKPMGKTHGENQWGKPKEKTNKKNQGETNGDNQWENHWGKPMGKTNKKNQGGKPMGKTNGENHCEENQRRTPVRNQWGVSSRKSLRSAKQWPVEQGAAKGNTPDPKTKASARPRLSITKGARR